MRRQRVHRDAESIWAPLADTMVLAATVFFIVMVALMLANRRTSERLVQREREMNRESREMKEFVDGVNAKTARAQKALMTLKGDNIVVDHDVVRISGDFLFDTNADVIKPAGHDALRNIAPQLREILARYDDVYVEVSGHTDSQACPRNPTCNWGLSGRRATNVVEILLRESSIASDRIRAVGYGDTRPLGGEFARNRRVELRVLPDLSGLLRRSVDVVPSSADGP